MSEQWCDVLTGEAKVEFERELAKAGVPVAMTEPLKNWVAKLRMPRKHAVSGLGCHEFVTAKFQATEADADSLGYMLGFCSVGQCVLTFQEVADGDDKGTA